MAWTGSHFGFVKAAGVGRTAGQSGGLQVRVAPHSVPLSLLFVVLRASPSTPGVRAHLRPRIVASRDERDHSQAGEHGGKEVCVCTCVSVCCLRGKFHFMQN